MKSKKLLISQFLSKSKNITYENITDEKPSAGITCSKRNKKLF